MASSQESDYGTYEMIRRTKTFDNLSMTSMLCPTFEFVVALDIGTTYSAYAYAHKDDINFEKSEMNISCNKAWCAGKSNCMTWKTPTSVLLHDNGELDLFGYEAENKYARLVRNKATDFYFFRRFKMELYKHIPTIGMTLKDVNGRSLLAEIVFAKAMAALKLQFENYIKKQAINLKPEEVRWVVTVPAIWSETAKRFMRKCANLAGIQDNQLIIALEPEAASIYCQYVKTKDISDPKLTVSSPGTQYMVVDLGGGTVDIAVHESLRNGYLKEIHHAAGDDCGGNSINQSFVQELILNFGGPLLQMVERNHPMEYFDIHREFEANKKTFDPFEEYEMSMRLPRIFLDKICTAEKKKDFKQILLLGPHNDRLKIEDDFVYISANLVRKRLFEPTAERIRKLITQIISNINNPRLTKIILVGGLADSSYIQEAVRKGFPNNKIIIPQDADLCVIKGAVMFGHSPHLISHRVSRFSFGTGIAPLFDSAKHDEKRMIIIEGKERCDAVFDLYAAAGTVLEMDTTIKKTYTTAYKYQKSMDLSVFASTKASPMYTDEDECEKIGHFAVTIKHPTEQERAVEVTVVFGNTELTVHAFDKKYEEKCEASFEIPLF